LAIGGSDGHVRIVEVATGQLVAELAGHRGDVKVAFAPCGRFLASGGADTTVLIWDLHRLGGRLHPSARSQAERERLWAALNGDDVPTAYRALAALAQSKGAVAFLACKLAPPAAATGQRIARLVAQLDDEDFVVRQRAQVELAKVVAAAEPALRRALAGKPSVEFKKRAGALLKPLETPAEWARRGRVLELLERIGTPEAGKLLKDLSERAPTSWQRREAQEALARLERRKAVGR
jgi:hypothetical protein